MIVIQIALGLATILSLFIFVLTFGDVEYKSDRSTSWRQVSLGCFILALGFLGLLLK